MQSDSKNYVGVQDDEITEPVHTIKSTCASVTLRKFTLTSAVSSPLEITEFFFFLFLVGKPTNKQTINK